jgi:DNA-binding FadR family transcriptional regulator
VVRASHNELLIAFIAAVSQPVYEATDLEGFNAPEMRNAAIQAHRRVMAAIRAGDGDAAARRMDRHIDAYVTDVKKATRAASARSRKETR